MSTTREDTKKLIAAYEALAKSHEARIDALKAEVAAGAPSRHAVFFIACIALLVWQLFLYVHMYRANVPVFSIAHAINIVCWGYLIFRIVQGLQDGPRRLWRTKRSREAQEELRQARLAYLEVLRKYKNQLSVQSDKLLLDVQRMASELLAEQRRPKL